MKKDFISKGKHQTLVVLQKLVLSCSFRCDQIRTIIAMSHLIVLLKSDLGVKQTGSGMLVVDTNPPLQLCRSTDKPLRWVC